MDKILLLRSGWECRSATNDRWLPTSIPGCWKEFPKTYPGPIYYRTFVNIPVSWSERRIWLDFGAVSYACEVQIDGVVVGTHLGMWDSFSVEISDFVRPGQQHELVVVVEKPASLVAGPASAPVPGRFPLKQTLAGFLPYVWGHAFGGIWQDVALRSTGQSALVQPSVRGAADGTVVIGGVLDGEADVLITLFDPAGVMIAKRIEHCAGVFEIVMLLEEPQPWSPSAPQLYRAELVIEASDSYSTRFGLRTLATDRTVLLLNGLPIYPRLALSWGWYLETLDCNPGPERVRADLQRLQALGYNGVKVCLWFPPTYYFELADELGMLLWVELPMWLPEPSSFFREQTPREYEQLVRQARDHPSVILYSLGCELNHAVDAKLLGSLFALVKQLAGDALVRDNSGSGAAYGGLLDEFAEYDDNHFYAELHHFAPLLEAYAPRWRMPRPWLFGEFCDYDTVRDPARLFDTDGEVVWWANTDPAINPQGARWQYDLPWHAERLAQQGLLEHATEFERLSYLHGLLHRKATIEMIRAFGVVGGYVITGEADTPITTAGMWNDQGDLKFDPAQFRSFNADLVLLLGWDARRAWVHGGDRVTLRDTHCFQSGEFVRPHLLLACGSTTPNDLTVRWDVQYADGESIAGGELAQAGVLRAGDVAELGHVEWSVPRLSQPRAALINVAARFGDTLLRNEWPIWLFPAHPWAAITGGALFDPAGRLGDFAQLAPLVPLVDADELLQLPAGHVVIATNWSEALMAFIERGGRAIVLQDGAARRGPLRAIALPFWREALRICAPHPAWGDFPHAGWAELQFFGCATDYALEIADQSVSQILWRLDMRTMAVHSYACELRIGAGVAIVSTLRFAGGQGAQPNGIARNPSAAYLLHCWFAYLRQSA